MKTKVKFLTVSLIGVLIGVVSFLAINQYAVQKKEARKVKSIKIGISIYDEYDNYMAALMQEITVWAKKKELEEGIAITLDVQSAGGSQITQNDQIENFVDKNYNVLCVGLVDRTDAAGVIDKAKSANIPIVFFNRELVDEDLQRWDEIYYVGANAAQAGNMQGEIIIEACEKDFAAIDKNKDGVLQYVILEGEPGHQDALVRTENSVNTISKAGYSMQKLGDEIANWNRGQAITKMTTLIEKYGDEIEIIISNNDEMALGALDALKNSDIEKYPIIVGVDGLPSSLDCVKRKEFEGTVYNDYKGQAKAIVEMAYALSLNKPFSDSIPFIDEKSVYLPYQKVTYDNVQEYIRMLGK